MKKTLLVLVVLCSAAYSSFAQSANSGKFNLGIDLGAPIGIFSDAYNVIIGGSLKYTHPIADKTFITGSAGYAYLPYKSEVKAGLQTLGIYKSGESYIPLKAGIKYLFDDDFYAEGQLGAAIYAGTGGGTAFAFSPGIGYGFSENVDLSMRYEGWAKNGKTLNQFALRLGFNF